MAKNILKMMILGFAFKYAILYHAWTVKIWWYRRKNTNKNIFENVLPDAPYSECFHKVFLVMPTFRGKLNCIIMGMLTLLLNVLKQVQF